MDLFNIPGVQSTKESDKKILNKNVKKTSQVVSKVGNNLADRIANIKRSVEQNLGEYKEKYQCVRDEVTLESFIDLCIHSGVCALDTETTGLNPMLDDIVGFSLYTPGTKAIYVPINHIDYMTNQKVSNQLSKEFCKEQLQRLIDNNVKMVMFNAKFDIRVLRHQIGVYFTPFWDGYLAQRLLNENEPENGLKALHNKYVLKGEKDAFAFSDLFEKMSFSLVPINSGYVYAARDAEITYELYEYQKPFLDSTNNVCIGKGLEKVSSVFFEIEMPLINVVADMEDRGIKVDLDYLHQLSEKYNNLLVEKEAQFYKLCDKYNDKIEAYRRSNPDNKLGSMINIASSTQIAILLYDILGEKPVPKQPARGTGEEVLKAIDNEFCKAILEYREVAKLISTYIDKMESVINQNDGKVHCVFNQYGAATGRFSSQDPNMQNIPSKNHDIRKMFVADDNYCLISTDYSQQEMRILAHATHDEKMIKSYQEGKDLYATIASIAFKKPYEDCLEFYLDENGNKTGETNKEGKIRRAKAKAITLGVCYGKGIPAIADDLKIKKEDAQEVYDNVMIAFPKLKQYMEDSQNMARELGYVDTIWGRKRRLPDMQLEPYEFDFSNFVSEGFDPLSFDESNNDVIIDDIQQKYIRLLNRAYGREEKEKIKSMAYQEGIVIKENGGFISQATRQCVNSRIQGSAGDLIKRAMILIANDDELKKMDCKMLLQVHDELISTCPIKYAKECSDRLCYLMNYAGKDLDVPFKSDSEITREWYGEPLVINN